MPLHPRVLNSVVRITSVGGLIGSGFIVSVPSESVPGKQWPYLVTAHHVIRGHEGLVEIDVPDPEIIGDIAEGIPIKGWVQPVPEVDLAIAPYPVDLAPRYQGVMLDHFMPRGSGIGLGGEILYVGIFAPENVPMARAGSIGAPNVPITVEDGSGRSSTATKAISLTAAPTRASAARPASRSSRTPSTTQRQGSHLPSPQDTRTARQCNSGTS
jgi:hypothetical protein